MEIGNVYREISSGKLMTILRFVGDEESDAMKNADEGLRPTGYRDGCPICQCFDGDIVRTYAFQRHELEEVDDSVWESWKPAPVAPPAEKPSEPSTLKEKMEAATPEKPVVIKLEEDQKDEEEDVFG